MKDRAADRSHEDSMGKCMGTRPDFRPWPSLPGSTGQSNEVDAI
jgi:hypothetical protein